jgi:DNA-binding HxlR family transcriptional regulator
MAAMTNSDDPADPADATSPAPQGALGAALDRVGDRWSLLLVEALLPAPRRFNELGEAVPGIAPNILSDRLRRLERAGIVVATPYSRRPPRMDYALTLDGRELAGALHLLAEWGSRRGGVGEPLRHELCGTPLQAAWHCPTCERLVADAESDELTRL